jgi:replicative DNA helicase
MSTPVKGARKYHLHQSVYDMNRMPPNNLEIERTILASMLDPFRSIALEYGIENINLECFYSTAHQIIFRHIKEMHDKDEVIDVLTLSEHLRKLGELEKVGAEPYLAELIDNIASAENIESHASILKDLRDRRLIISQSCALMEAAYNPEIDLKDAASRSSTDFLFQTSKNKIVGVSDYEKEIYDDYDAKKMYETYDTGWKNMPVKLALQRLNVLTGIANTGKSEWFDQVMINTAKLHNWRWLVYSPENFPVKLHISKLAEKCLGKRFIGSNFRMSKTELSSALAFIREHFDFIDTSDARFGSDEIISFTRMYLKKYNIQGTLIDPFKNLKLNIPHGMSRKEGIEDFLESYRSVARAFNVSANIIAHPTKLLKNLPNAKVNPGWYDPVTPYQIDGSSGWFDTPDTIFSIWRPYRKNTPVIYVFKRRFWYDGQLGEAHFNWNEFTTLFAESLPEQINSEQESLNF